MDTITQLEVTALEARALRAAINWATMLNAEGKIELYDFQLEAFNELLPKLEAIGQDFKA